LKDVNWPAQVAQDSSDCGWTTRVLISRTQCDLYVIDRTELRLKTANHRRRDRRHRTDAGRDKDVSLAGTRIKCADAAYELSCICKIKIVASGIDARFGYAVVSGLKWACCVNHNRRTIYGMAQLVGVR
jgi:hypothetical protein